MAVDGKFYAQANFVTSAAKFTQCPLDSGWEVAFVGRSNAGKSSALNAICQRRQLARISRTPGRTQLLNFFSLNDDRRLVDLPGYGFAKVPRSVREEWDQLMSDYLGERQSLKGLVVAADIRRGLSAQDIELLEWVDPRGIPVHFLLTKADKLSRGAGLRVLQLTRNGLRNFSDASAQLFSAVQPQGLPEAWEVLDRWLDLTPA